MSPPFTAQNAARYGSKGGKKGGKARAKSLPAKDRQKIARMGGKARWAKAHGECDPNEPSQS